MKKYQQLILLVIAVIGTAFFIFYKHEYNRLRAVLQALDTFGTENDAINPRKTSINERISSSTHPSTWTQIGNIYLHTATSSQPSIIDVLSFGMSFTDVKKVCLIWSETKNEPTSGQTSIEYLDSDGINQLVLIKCSADKEITKIFGVSLSIDLQGKTYRDFLPVEILDRSGYEKEIGVCALLDEEPFINKRQLIEFIEFHRVIGASHFYFYSDALAPSVRDLLDEYRGKSTAKINIINWNPPITFNTSIGIRNSIYFNDCLLRSRLVASHVAILNVNELLIPRFHEKLQNIVKDVEEIDSKPRAYLQFYSKTFCLDYANDPNAVLPLISLQKTWWQELETDISFSLINNRLVHHITSDFQIIFDSEFRNYLVPLDVVVLHRYANCKGVNGILKHENAAQKFVKMLIKDGLINLVLKK